jgi:hypothetical protein
LRIEHYITKAKERRGEEEKNQTREFEKKDWYAARA